MDSLDRLSHSLEAAVALIHSLRRENRDLARSMAENSAQAAKSGEIEGLRRDLDEARIEIERLRLEPALDIESQERSRQAELESARLAQELEEARKGQLEEKRILEGRIHDLELRILAAEREEVMPLPDRGPELEGLSRRCSELELMLAETQGALEKSKGDITAMQVRIAESADPEEVSAWQGRIHDLGSELEGLRHLAGLKEKLEAERAEIKRNKRLLAGIFNEREMTRRKLDEIFSTLDNLRLS